MTLPTNPDRIINSEWTSNPDWERLPLHVQDSLDRFILYLESKDYSIHTVNNYFARVRRAVSRGGDPLRYIISASSNPEARTRQQALRVWSEFIGGAEGADLTARIRAWRLENSMQDGPKGGRKQKVKKVGLDVDVFKRLRALACADPNVRGVVVAMMLITPLRIGDILRITREQALDGWETGTMSLRLKGNKYEDYPARPVARQLRQLLDIPGWERVQDLLGNSYSAGSKRVSRRLKRYGKKINYNKKLHLHLLRHTVLTLIADNDGLRVASGLAGHDSELTTISYLRKSPPMEQKEAALNRLMAL